MKTRTIETTDFEPMTCLWIPSKIDMMDQKFLLFPEEGGYDESLFDDDERYFVKLK